MEEFPDIDPSMPRQQLVCGLVYSGQPPGIRMGMNACSRVDVKVSPSVNVNVCVCV